MQSVYRQIAGLQRHRTVVLTERHVHADLFPFEPVIVLQKTPAEVRTRLRKEKERKKRPRGNFIRRFWYKHVIRQWPPPMKPVPTSIASVEQRPAPAPTPAYDAYDLVPVLREQGVELLHVYYGHKAVKYLPMIKRWGGPFVVSFHGMDVSEAAYKPTDPATLAEVFAAAQLVLARSESLLERVASLGCPPEKLRLNRAAISTAHLPTPARCPPDDGRWIFLQACRLIPKKGLLTTLAAMQSIVADWPRAQLVLAGDGPMIELLREQVITLGLADNVVLTGWCSQAELIDWYQRAHIFLHPSEVTEKGDREGVPNALLEAMATGLPAVATWHGGIPEAITDGEDGLLVPERSPDSLAAAVLRLTHDPALLQSLSIACARSVEERFGATHQLAQLEACYEEALALAPVVS